MIPNSFRERFGKLTVIEARILNEASKIINKHNQEIKNGQNEKR